LQDPSFPQTGQIKDFSQDIAEGLRGTGQNERKLRIELAKHLLCVVTGETPEVISKEPHYRDRRISENGISQ
jgi:hypothetical protein